MPVTEQWKEGGDGGAAGRGERVERRGHRPDSHKMEWKGTCER